MQLKHARIIIQEPKYLEALKVIAEAEAKEAEGKALKETQEISDDNVGSIEDQEPGLQESVN